MKPARFILLALLTTMPVILLAADEVLPPSGFEGWKVDGKGRTYAGEALYNHIDGGAEPFLELGFETCEVRRYTKADLELTAECYRMSDAAAALGIYLMQCGKETPDPALGERHTASPNQLTLVRGRCLLRLTGRPGASPERAVLLSFARWTAARVREEAAPAILSRAPSEDAVEGSLRIVRGPFTVQALAPPFPAEALPFGKGITGIAVDQRRGDRALTVLLVEYPDAAAASKAAATLSGGTPADRKGGASLDVRAEGAILRAVWSVGGSGQPGGK